MGYGDQPDYLQALVSCSRLSQPALGGFRAGACLTSVLQGATELTVKIAINGLGRMGKLLLRDLFDSGATLKEITRVLLQAGALQVNVLTITRTIHAAS